MFVKLISKTWIVQITIGENNVSEGFDAVTRFRGTLCPTEADSPQTNPRKKIIEDQDDVRSILLYQVRGIMIT